MFKIKNKIYIEEEGQGSVEIILLIGSVLVIVILAGSYVLNISNSINNNLKTLIEGVKDNILLKI
ncbi:MAG: class III signal peptide-containing protein [Methanobrevibacter sp.]|uniref:class III signal peptide-containing protein n=1 Tax=Methanobrevibacter sp. TaxID=66852 RepID=UPI00261A33B2|nr:class III signal peptide-containing protein [Methanobrevibacter sp.]MEA4956739.1 class III signal peptide-containing protein [Methanobrevibacter sp.]